MVEDCSVRPLSDAQRAQLISDVVDMMSSQGLRTMAVAYRDFVSGLLSSLTVNCNTTAKFSYNCHKMSVVCDVDVL